MDSLREIAGYFGSAINFMLIITILVAVHELGHYWVAKWCGMEVEAFAVMMGGIRSTRLEGNLKKPILPTMVPFAVYVVSFLGMLVGTTTKNYPLTLIGLFLVGIVVPVWVLTRIAALYRLPFSEIGRTVAFPIAASLVMLVFASKGLGNLLPHSVLIALLGGFHVAMILVYYKPVLGKAEGAPMGKGQLVHNGEKTPVDFKPVWSKKNKEGTEFAILAFPLGGFVRIKGTEPQEDGSEVAIERGFYSTSPFKRLLVTFAGPLFSILLGMLLFLLTFTIYGVMNPTKAPIVGALAMDGAAFKAGLKPDDKILSIGEEKIDVFLDINRVLATADGTPVSVRVDRAGKELNFTVTPTLTPKPVPVLDKDFKPTDVSKRLYKLGVAPKFERERYSFSKALATTLTIPGEAGMAFLKIFQKPQSAGENLSGPGGMAKMTHEAGSIGMEGLLLLAGNLSISLGFLNLLPIVPLDGGQMVVAIAEMCRKGKRLSMQVQQGLSTVGFFLIMLLMFVAWSTDGARMLGK